jgi:serine/threonine protein kinase
MTPERYQRVIELFQAASDCGPDARPALLAEACAGDDDLRREVEAMLAADAQAGGFLEQPADDFAAAALTARKSGSLIGQRISHYEVISLLGVGGMGEVYRAKDARLNRDVAIKFADEAFSDRFEREARTIAALNHPNICTLHDVGPNYLVMELVEGETLAKRIKRGALPWNDALSIAKQIADALEASHEKGIIHRDLKPANIKIKPDGTVKVLDFGLAKMAPNASPRPENSPALTTHPGIVLGTAAYMSPEQARGNTVDKRTDVWAFGVVMYEMLSAQRAFPGDTTTDVLAAVATREPQWERAPVKARRLLRKCLEKDPERRLRHIGDFELLLEEAPGPSNFGNRRLLWAVATTVLAVITVGASWVAWRATPVSQRPPIRLTLDLGANAVSSLNSTVVISPDGKRIVFPARGPQGKRQLATRLLDQAQATFLPGTETAAARSSRLMGSG